MPRDDVQFVDALNTDHPRPVPDSDFAILEPGRHCATVFYRRIGQAEGDSNSYRWCFSLH